MQQFSVGDPGLLLFMPGPIFVVREIITTFINIYVGVLIDEPSDVKYRDGCRSCD